MGRIFAIVANIQGLLQWHRLKKIFSNQFNGCDFRDILGGAPPQILGNYRKTQMIYSGNLKIILDEQDKEIKRKFHPSFKNKNTTFGKGLHYLLTKKEEVSAAFPPDTRSIINEVLSDKLELFTQPQDMPWYLDVIAERIIKDRRPYKIHIKACRDHWFFDVSFKSTSRSKQKLVLPPFFHQTPLPESTDDKEKVRGLADTLLFLSPLIKDVFEHPITGLNGNPVEIKDIITDAIDWCTIELDAQSVKQIRNGRGSTSRQYELNVKATVDWDYSAIKEGKKSITIYVPDPKSKLKSKDKAKEIIVSSKNIRKAIGDLSEAWHNPVSGSILLSAWTGSGKEVLQDILTYALSVHGTQTVALGSPQLGSGEKPLEDLFTVIDGLGFFNKPNKSNRRKLNTLSVLFLDEIHHPSAQKLREQLLTVIESKAMTTAKGEKVDFEKARYLFAASEPPDKLRTHHPPDFWTRIEYTIVMNHPLRLETRKEINETLQQFFCAFWRKAAEDHRSKATDQQTIGIIEYLCPNNNEKVLGVISKAFADTLDSPLIPAVSIRLLRAIINRLFSKAIYHMRTVKTDDDKKLSKLMSEMDKWIVKIFINIVPEIKPEGLF
jgi:hypothetical protein